jgi:hypothetical protein
MSLERLRNVLAGRASTIGRWSDAEAAKKVAQKSTYVVEIADARKLVRGRGLAANRMLRLSIFALESRNEFRHRLHRFDRADALPASPDVPPGLGF